MATIVPMMQGGGKSNSARLGSSVGGAMPGFINALIAQKEQKALTEAITQASQSTDRKTASGILMPFAKSLDDITSINDQLDKLFPPAEFDMVEGFDVNTGAKETRRIQKGTDPFPSGGDFSGAAQVGTPQEFVNKGTGKAVGSFFSNSPAFKRMQKDPNVVSRHLYDKRQAAALKRETGDGAGGKVTLSDLKVATLKKMAQNEQTGRPPESGLTASQVNQVQSELSDPDRLEAWKVLNANIEGFKTFLKASPDERQGIFDSILGDVKKSRSQSGGIGGGEGKVDDVDLSTADIPGGFTAEDVKFTAEQHGMTYSEVLRKMGDM